MSLAYSPWGVAWRWRQDDSLPAFQIPSSTYMTSTVLIDLWILTGCNTAWNKKHGESLPDGTLQAEAEIQTAIPRHGRGWPS